MRAYFARLRRTLDSYPSRLEERRTRYLTGSTFILAEIARHFLPRVGPVVDAIVALGLLCFLFWFLSGVLKSRIEVQESARRVLELYDRWYDEVTLHDGHWSGWSEEVERKTTAIREEFREAVRSYIQALHEAYIGGWTLQGAREMAKAEQPLGCGGWVKSLRLHVSRHVLRHLL